MMNGVRRLALPLLLALTGCRSPSAPARVTTLTVAPLGGVSKASVEAVRRALQATYRLDVRVASPRPLPASAFYPPRRRYRAERLIACLAKDARTDKVLGVTNADISTTAHGRKDWGVAGLAGLGRRSGVASSFRLKGSLTRLADVAVHETAHTLGRDHCPVPGCTMHDAEGKVSNVGRQLCPECRRALARWVR